MRMREELADQTVWGRLASVLLTFTLALALIFTCALLIAPRAYANGDTVTLKITSASPYIYATSPITMRATVQLAAPLSIRPTTGSIRVQVSNVGSFDLNWISISADGLTLTYGGNIDNDIIPSGYTAKATYLNPDTKVTTTSNTVSFTVDKAPSKITCQSRLDTVIAGSSVVINTYIDGVQSSQGETFTVRLSGPVNIPAVTLQTDYLGNLTITAPTQVGTYTLLCAFAGDSRYTGSSSTTTNAFQVHDNAKLAGMKLYTNPTTVTRGIPLEFYIVLQPASGYPKPTGYLNITMGIFTYNSIKVGSNGDTLVQLDPLPVHTSNPFTQITIIYGGDSYYRSSSFNFPLTNPGIPGSGNSGGSGNGGASATPTAGAGTPTPTTTATVVASPTPASTTHPVSVSSPDNTISFWLAGGLGALAILGALASGIIIAQRRKRAKATPDQEPITEADATPVATGPDPDQ